MGHAGSKFAEDCIFLLVGKARSKFLTFIQRARHRIEPIKQKVKLAGDALSLRTPEWGPHVRLERAPRIRSVR